MKSFALVAISATLAAAQLSSLAPCGQFCINSMMQKAPSLGCATGDVACLCKNPEYGYGIRDCSNQYCGADVAAAQAAIKYGALNCAEVASSASGSSATASGSAASSAASSGSMTGAGGASGSMSGSMSGSAIATNPLVVVATSDGQKVTSTTGYTTIYAGASGASAASSMASASGASESASASSAGASASASASSAGASASASASSAGASIASSASSAVAGASSAASSALSATTGGMPRMTAAPALGLGVAALALLAL